MLPPLNYTRFIWSFRDQKYGWTESWVAGSLLTPMQMNFLIGSYLQVRLPLMSPGIWADYASGRQLNQSGVSYSTEPNLIVTTNGTPPKNSNGISFSGFGAVMAADGTPPDRPYSALMFQMNGAAGQKKNIFLSGVPDDVIIDPFGPTYSAAYTAAINNFINYLVGNPALGWIGTSGNQQVKQPITSITAGPNATVNSVAGTFAVGSVVQVGGMRGLKGYRGQYRVATSAAGSTGLQGYNPPAALAKPNGYIQQVQYTFIAAAAFRKALETKRSRGKGSNLPVGRRKARSN